ncbi:MAG TPA: PadR family transcriptional regulator, partial [Streptosporangiaceae bacterium]
MPRLYGHEIKEGMPPNGGNGYTTVEYLTLGLVAWLEPCTSYDLKREVERTISHFWTFSHTALYQAPPQLAAAGLLLEEQEETGRRRRLYRLTPDGRA